MPTSGSWNYQVTALQVITDCAENLGVIASGQPLDSNDLATFLRTLNLLVKQWQGRSDKFPGLKVWTRQRLSIFFVSGQVAYSIGPNSSDDRASVNTLSTTLGANKAANATSVTVSDTTGMTAADVIGIVTTAGPIGWSTISSVDSATGLTLPANSIGAAASGAVVFTYTSKAQRFVDWDAALLRDNSQTGQPIDIPLAIYTDVAQYEQLTQKFAQGDPTAILIEPGRLSTVVRTNFSPTNMYKNLRLTVYYPAEDYDDATGADDISYPQEYYASLSWELSFRCAAKFGRPWTPDMQAAYQVCVTEGVNLNPQNTHLSFEPGRDIYDTGSPFTRP